MIELESIVDLFCKASASIVLLIIVTHLLAKLFGKKEALKLDKNSFVVIAGACMGIGKQMALELARLHKCRLLIIDRRKDLFEEITKEINECGGTCECKYGDLGDKQAVKELTKYLLDRNDKINLFIYNAGIMFPKRAWNTTEEEHELVMRVNYFTPTYMIKYLEPLLNNSHVAVVASMVAIISGGTNVSIYSSSKHAIFAYLSSLRQQYKKDGKNITVSIGCPYAINTTLFEGFKTRLDFLFRILDEKYVGKRLVKQFVEKKQVCFMYVYEAVLFKFIELLPTSIIDYCAIKLDISNFGGREQQNINKKAN